MNYQHSHETDCDQTTMGLPSVKSAVFLIAQVILVKCRCLGGAQWPSGQCARRANVDANQIA
jgi:hypothetical protein